MTDEYQPRGVHLVGSVPLGSAEEVFRTAAAALGDRLERLPDGETGERLGWIGWQYPLLAGRPELEGVPADPDAYSPLPRVRLRPGANADDLTFPNLGYADAAKASYATFARLKREGAIPARYRFQVSLPTPLAPVSAWVVPEVQAAVEPAYEQAMLAELDAITAAVPPDQLAIQWDTAVEFGVLEGMMPAHFDPPLEGIVARLARIGRRVPAGVELGYHLCYGDYRHAHFIQPVDAGKLVEVANGVSARLDRPIDWIHLPAPRDRTDAAYFAPLRGLRLHPETTLYLGLVHFTDGIEGTRRRIAAAHTAVTEFGVATECGFGRRPPETIPALLALHAEAVTPAS